MRAIQERVRVVDTRCSGAAASLSNVSALRKLLVDDPYALGRALATCLQNKLQDRLCFTPPRRRGEETRAKSAYTIDVDCSRGRWDQLVIERSLVCFTARGHAGRLRQR